MTLIDPSYAKNHMPLIASVAEHAPTVWTSYFLTIGVIIIFVPLGFYFSLVRKMTHGKLFLAMYGVFSVYFSCVMVRLMLVLAPSVCILAGIGVSEIIRKASRSIRESVVGETKKVEEEVVFKNLKKKRVMPVDVAIVVIIFVVYILRDYIYHSN
jgi:dolichyl-diphosphooligosaccharide--protein glycosyltransferase